MGERAAAVDRVPGPDSVPVPIRAAAAPEAVPGAAQTVRTANGDVGRLEEPPFQMSLGIFTSTGGCKNIQATVDYSLPLNVVTSKCLKELGFDDPFERPLPPDLSDLAAEGLPGPYGWCTLSLHASVNRKSRSVEVGFVVVDVDDDRRGLLLGREFKGVTLESGVGIFPNFATPKSKEDRDKDDKERKKRQTAEAVAEAERKRQAAKRLDQQRKGDPKSGHGAGKGTSA